MNTLSEENVEFIKTTFFSSKHFNFDDFCELTTTEELHFLAIGCTDLIDGELMIWIEPLKWIVGTLTCDRATALLVYWRLRSGLVHHIGNVFEVEKYSEYFRLMQTIQENFTIGKYENGRIAFDPENDFGTNHLAKSFFIEQRWNMPEKLKVPVVGEPFPDYFELYPTLFFCDFEEDDDNTIMET